MNEYLRSSELLEGLAAAHVERLAHAAQTLSLVDGEYLFHIGDLADRLFVVLEGKVEVCLPISVAGGMRDVAVEIKAPGAALGWSAFVRPNRFTLSARAAAPAKIAAFPRAELERLMAEDAALAVAFSRRIAEIVGGRLLRTQAMWARELQRALSSGLPLKRQLVEHPGTSTTT